MRDVLIIAAIIVIILGLVYWAAPKSDPSVAVLTTQGGTNEVDSHAVRAGNRGSEAKSAAKSSAVAAQGKSRNSEKSFEESEKLPSIYDSERVKPVSKKKPKVVHGVPLQSYAQQSLNRLPGEVPVQTPNGVRVFFQCIEVGKSQAASLSEKECKELAARGSAHGMKFGTLGGL